MVDYANLAPFVISIHAPLAGCVFMAVPCVVVARHFNPRAPCGARRSWPSSAMSCAAFQSTRPLRGATRPRAHGCVRGRRISIHAPLAGRDAIQVVALKHTIPISIHAPLAGRDLTEISTSLFTWEFQSTRPLRGATMALYSSGASLTYFNPRAPCGARPSYTIPSFALLYFNPRAPCGARRRRSIQISTVLRFQSTRPLRGATWMLHRRRCHHQYFNPRAPCGARPIFSTSATEKFYFNPRAPCGARHHLHSYTASFQEFQSTRPLRGATLTAHPFTAARMPFQSTRPLRGATKIVDSGVSAPNFNPRAPCGARPPAARAARRESRDFNPRAPCGARLAERACRCRRQRISIHAPLAGRDIAAAL